MYRRILSPLFLRKFALAIVPLFIVPIAAAQYIPDPMVIADPRDTREALESGHIYPDSGQGTDPLSDGGGATVAFDPSDPDHAVFGDEGFGASVTFDSGKTWAQAAGLSINPADRAGSNKGAYLNVFSVAFSPVDPSVVWAEGSLSPDVYTTGPLQLYRSEDGGRSFAWVFDNSSDTPLHMWTVLAPHPTERDILYWSGSVATGDALFRYDHASSAIVSHVYTDFNQIDAIEFSPADPTVMYLGASIVVYGP